jgi:hypothetical protein
MSYLVIEQLENNVTFTQQIRLFKSTNLEALRLNMYKHGSLNNGTLSIGIYDGENLLGSMSLSYLELNTLGSYYHGMVRFLPLNAIAIRKNPKEPYIELDIKVTITGHINSSSAFIGLVKEPYPIIEQYNVLNKPKNSPGLAVDVWYHSIGMELYSV